MKRSRFSEEQIREHEAGSPTMDLCRKHGVSSATFYKWKAKYGGLDVSDANRLKTLEDENAKLKKLLAETILDHAFGYRRLHFLQTREGCHMNHKRFCRLYREEKLQVRRRSIRKRATGVRAPFELPSGPNQRWSLVLRLRLLHRRASFSAFSPSSTTSHARAWRSSPTHPCRVRAWRASSMRSSLDAADPRAACRTTGPSSPAWSCSSG